MLNKELTILYVEDDEILRVQYEEFFQRRCSKLLKAKDGLEAKKHFDENHIDILITDIRMPNMDGIELIKYIRSKSSDIQIIVTSAFSDPDYLLKAINEGVSRYILKPFKSQSLKNTIDEVIEFINIKKDNLAKNKKLDLIINNISSSVFLLDYDLNIIKANKIANDDFKIDEINDKSIFDLISTDDNDFKKILTENIFEEKNIENIEIELENKLNNKLNTKINVALIEDEELILLTIKNSTTLVKYEKLIKKYVQTLDKHVMSLRVDTNFSIIYASKAFCEYIGYEQFELVGRKINNFIEDAGFIKEVPINIKLNDELKYQQKMINSKFDSKWVEIIFTDLVLADSSMGYSIIIHDINDRKMLENAVIKDSLTNLYNRRYFNEIKNDFLNSAKRSEDFVSFCVLDIDNFKLYNDNYGHQKGDNVLLRVGDALKNTFKRANDYAFRIGGEEFVLLFRSENGKNAKIIANRVLNEIRELNIEHKKSSKSILTASIGLCVRKATEVSNIDDMYTCADDLLYKAKANGKDICESNV